MIKNLIFDCGGVVLDVNYSLSFNAFRQLTTKPELFENFSINQFKHIASEFEIGKQSIEEFYSDIRSRLSLDATDNQIKYAWNAMLLSFIPDSIEYIGKLKEHFTVSLFSNTNELHYIEFESVCRKLLKIFDNCFYSHKIGFKKPNLNSFEYIFKKTKYMPEETVFIDDSEENCIAASKLGIIPFHYTKEWNMEKLYNYVIGKLH
jgi:putative hydrolase of the HAD superfamily